MKTEKKKNYKLRSILFRITGISVLSLTTLGGFFGYQLYTDFGQLTEDMQNFYVVNQETMKLNSNIGLPLLIGGITLLIVLWRKNKEFLKGKLSLGLLITIGLLYVIYSIAEIAMITLSGAFVGSIIDDFVFKPIAISADNKSKLDKEMQIEYDKERVRIAARKKAAEDVLDGSV